MEREVELKKRVLELSETTLEGLEHIRVRTANGHFEETFSLFYDTVNSFHEMVKVIQPMLSELKQNMLEEKAAQVTRGMDLLLSAYEGSAGMPPLEILQFTLLPKYRDWKRELKDALEPFIVS